MSRQHPRHRLDDLLINGVRLSVVAALDGLDRAEFALIRDAIEVTDSELSKQIATLEAAGYVRVDKGKVGRRPRTWLSITPDGASAYRAHLTALRDIAEQDIAVQGIAAQAVADQRTPATDSAPPAPQPDVDGSSPRG
jgi:DNA-binding MarR family transcriptional regulator